MRFGNQITYRLSPHPLKIIMSDYVGEYGEVLGARFYDEDSGYENSIERLFTGFAVMVALGSVSVGSFASSTVPGATTAHVINGVTYYADSYAEAVVMEGISLGVMDIESATILSDSLIVMESFGRAGAITSTGGSQFTISSLIAMYYYQEYYDWAHYNNFQHFDIEIGESTADCYTDPGTGETYYCPN